MESFIHGKLPLPRKPALSIPEFQRLLAEEGFSFLPLTSEFTDRRYRTKPPIPAVKRGRGIDRMATLAALRAARALAEAEVAAVEAARAKREQIAANIAPQAIAPCRADLDGPGSGGPRGLLVDPTERAV